MQVKVALLGFGTVGSSGSEGVGGVEVSGVTLTHVYNRNVARKRESAAAKYVAPTAKWTENIDDVLKSNVDVVIELMGGLNPVEGWLKKALSSGKHVVTANKQLIAYRGAKPAEAGCAEWGSTGVRSRRCWRRSCDSGDSARVERGPRDAVERDCERDLQLHSEPDGDRRRLCNCIEGRATAWICGGESFRRCGWLRCAGEALHPLEDCTSCGTEPG